MISSWLYRSGTGLALAALTLLFTAGTAFAQTSRIEGTVRSAQTADPITGASVSVVGTSMTGTTNENGYYAIDNVPVGTYNVRVNVIGFQPVTITNQVVSAGLPTTVNFSLRASILRIEGVVVTGVASQTEVVKLPFTVDQISAEDLPVAPMTAAESIRGKVAGARVIRGEGTPGEGSVTVLLRGATSISTVGRSNQPLYVVDGVILSGNMVDIDALNIESIEVVKGAAAAALYGARAANGVVSITTQRGRDIPEGDTRITWRSEFGRNNIENAIDQAQSHWYTLADCSTHIASATGTCIRGTTATASDTSVAPNDRAFATRRTSCPVGSINCDPLNPGLGFNPEIDNVASVCAVGTVEGADCLATGFQYAIPDNAFTGTTYDNLDRFFDPGSFYTHTFGISHRTGTTNFLASFHETNETGIVEGLNGYLRRGARINIDHQLGGSFDFSASAMYSQSRRDDPQGGGSNAFHGLNFYPIDVDLLERYTAAQANIDNGSGTIRDTNDYLVNPDELIVEENPIYSARNAEIDIERSRILGNFRLRWRPAEVFDLEADFSFDRFDGNETTFNFVGFRTIDASSINRGRFTKNNTSNQAINLSGTAAYNNTFGDFNMIVKLRGLLERQRANFFFATGRDLAADEVRDLDVLQDQTLLDVGSTSSEIRSLGYFLSTQFDYADKYIVDALVRRDGSSLFGEDERWNTYYRLSGAWRLSQEGFWPFSFLDEFKIRASVGTAGGRPAFTAQYETFSVNGGIISKGVLGNSFLKPEYAKETEVGVDMLMFGRLSLTITYAKSDVSDQILQVPLTGYFGFSSQWRNAGTLGGHTWEGTLQWAVIQSPSFSWNLNFVIDQTRQKITEFDLPAFRHGPRSLFYVRDNEPVGEMYGSVFATTCQEVWDGSAFSYTDNSCLVGNGGAYQNNDEGYLVPVGTNNDYTDGPLNNNFGSKITIDGVQYDWGLPFEGWASVPNPATGANDTTNFRPIGNTIPDFNWGLANTFRFGGFQLYALFDAQVGGDIYNNTRQWAARENNANWVDQGGKADGDKKTLDYAQRLYFVNGNNDFFVEDGSFIKFRELSLRYTFSRNMLEPLFGNFIKRISLSIIGRNLMTFTDYQGYDPEVSSSNSAGVIFRVDEFEYPNYRTFTGAVEIEF